MCLKLVKYLILLTIHQQMEFCTEFSHPCIISCSTQVVTVVQSVVKWIYSQDTVAELVAIRKRECLVSFTPRHIFDDILRSAICDVTCQCHTVPFSWFPGTCASHFCTWRVWNRTLNIKPQCKSMEYTNSVKSKSDKIYIVTLHINQSK